MKNIFNYLIVSVLAFAIFISCKNNTDNTPQTCYLSTVSNLKGNILETMTYDGNNRLVTYKNDSANVTYNFTYNTQNSVDKINVAYKVGTKIYTFIATFTYDGTGKATKSVTTLNDKPYQTDVYAFNTNAQLSSIISTDSQGEIDALRFEYLGENIAKVYQKLDGDKEYLYYEITKFDDKKSVYPEAFKALAMGLAGLVDDFSYMNKNNALSEKYYEDDKSVFFSADNTFEYNSTLQPTKVTSLVVDAGHKITGVQSFQYNCK
jgi:hypothetical protein